MGYENCKGLTTEEREASFQKQKKEMKERMKKRKSQKTRMSQQHNEYNKTEEDHKNATTAPDFPTEIRNVNEVLLRTTIGDCKTLNSLKTDPNVKQDVQSKKTMLQIIKDEIHIIRSLANLEEEQRDKIAKEAQLQIRKGESNVAFLDRAKRKLQELGIETGEELEVQEGS